MSANKPKRGGKREGAGRKTNIGATERKSITLTPDDLAFLLSINKNLSAAVRALIARIQTG